MPIVYVYWLAGRSVSQKREIAKRITDAIADVGGIEGVNVRQSVVVQFIDQPKENISKGGVLLADSMK